MSNYASQGLQSEHDPPYAGHVDPSQTNIEMIHRGSVSFICMCDQAMESLCTIDARLALKYECHM